MPSIFLFQDKEAQKELSESNDDLSENNTTKVIVMQQKHLVKMSSEGMLTDKKQIIFRRKIFSATCSRSLRNQQRALQQTRYCD